VTDGRDWLAAEESLGTWRRELARLKRRARARLGLTIGTAALATVAALWFVGRRVPPAETRVLIRVSESPLLRQDSPLPSGELAEYLWDVAFSNQNLDAIIEEHDLYPLARARGAPVALETLRDDVDLEVYRNYFLNQRGINDPSRTARIVVKYAHKDPETSIKVARDLARLIIATESSRRTASSLDLAGLADRTLAKTNDLLDQRQRELAAATAEVTLAKKRGDRDRVGALQVVMARLTRDVRRHQMAVKQARESKRRADFMHSIDERGIGLVFEVVDERPPPRPPDRPTRLAHLALLGLASFLLLLPVCAVGVGAFDGRVHDREDVSRLGLEVLGHVPPFRGAGVGSLNERRGRRHA
jgi:hypothetical protein